MKFFKPLNFAFLLGLIPWPAFAYESLTKNVSYVDSKYVTLGTGLGFTGFANQTGIKGETGFGLKLSMGHHFNEYLEAEFSYQFSTFRLSSPDPVSPAAQVNTRAAMNQEALQLIVSYPHFFIQPYLQGGFGSYDIFDVNRETNLHFDSHLMFPVGAGIRTYFYKNSISLNFDFSYQFLLHENQSPDRLKALGLNKVSFEAYSMMTSVVFHFL